MKNRGSADDGDVAKVSLGDGMEDVEFSSDLIPVMAVASAPSGSSPYASSLLPSVAHGIGNGIKKLEHALPNEPVPSAGGLRMADSSLESSPVAASNRDFAPGAFQVRSSRNTAASRTFRSPISSYTSNRELTIEESKQEEGVSRRVPAGSRLYTVEAQRVQDGNEEGAVIVAEAQHVKMKWYQRRWIFLGLALFACGLAAVVVLFVLGVLVVRPPAATTAPAATAMTPVAIACNFLSIPNVTTCQSTFTFDSFSNEDDRTTGSTIPSEIGLLTQLKRLDFERNSLTSTIPSEIGLLQNLTWLAFDHNSLKGTIPSEIRLLTELEYLYLNDNEFKGTIPSSLCSLPSLNGYIYIDCDEITCASGCCFETSYSPCG